MLRQKCVFSVVPHKGGATIRDRADSSRPVSPLVIAKDAHVIDTSRLTIQQVINEIVGVLEKMGLRT